VIVLNWNGKHFLELLLPGLAGSVRAAPGDHEVIVVDNGSTDGSAEFVAAAFPAMRLVRLPENRFFVRGNLAGVRVATRDILVFLNNDMRVEPGFLASLLARFGPPDLFAVTSRIEMAGTRVETGRTRSSFRSGAFHNVQVDGPPSDLIPAMWAGGGSSAFDARKFRELGGFEDLYHPFYVEDQSLSYQAWRRGWRVLFEPGSVVHHVHRGTSAKVFGADLVERIDRRNRELFFWRSVTDPRMVLAHGVLLPWNALKDSRRAGLGLQFRALLGTLPRLPRALLLRERSRPGYVRSDRRVLELANHVGRHRRASGSGRVRDPVLVLEIGREPRAAGAVPGARVLAVALTVPDAPGPPPEDIHRLLPRRFWGARDGELRDRMRDLLAETDWDLVHLRDPVVAALALPFLEGVRWVLEVSSPEEVGEPSGGGAPGFLERLREERMMRRIAGKAGAVIARAEGVAESLRRVAPRAPVRLIGSPEELLGIYGALVESDSSVDPI
jgi:GT2 family glycosyltransferase